MIVVRGIIVREQIFTRLDTSISSTKKTYFFSECPEPIGKVLPPVMDYRMIGHD